MLRFTLIALPVLVMLMGVCGFVLEAADLQPEARELARLGLTRPAPLAAGYRLAGWCVESAGLTALFLLIQARTGAWWLDGLMTGWIAWIFRGPAMVLTVATWTRLPRDPWWPLSVQWLVIYTLCGAALALLARRTGPRRSPRPASGAEPSP